MKYTLALLALGLAAAAVASADKPVYPAQPAAPAQHAGSSVSGGPSSNNERWDENGDDFTYSPPPHFESQPQPVYQTHANFESQPAIQTSYHDVGPSYTTQSYRYQPHHQQQQLTAGSPFGISQVISTGLSILATVFILSSIALFIKNMWPKVMAHFGHGRSLQVDEIAEITGLMLDAYNRFTELEE